MHTKALLLITFGFGSLALATPLSITGPPPTHWFQVVASSEDGSIKDLPLHGVAREFHIEKNPEIVETSGSYKQKPTTKTIFSAAPYGTVDYYGRGTLNLATTSKGGQQVYSFIKGPTDSVLGFTAVGGVTPPNTFSSNFDYTSNDIDGNPGTLTLNNGRSFLACPVAGKNEVWRITSDMLDVVPRPNPECKVLDLKTVRFEGERVVLYI